MASINSEGCVEIGDQGVKPECFSQDSAQRGPEVDSRPQERKEDWHDWRAETKGSQGRGFITQNVVSDLAIGSYRILLRTEEAGSVRQTLSPCPEFPCSYL